MLLSRGIPYLKRNVYSIQTTLKYIIYNRDQEKWRTKVLFLMAVPLRPYLPPLELNSSQNLFNKL